VVGGEGLEPPTFCVGNVNTTATADFRGNIVRVGLNYQLH
jgi:hypothetical protein